MSTWTAWNHFFVWASMLLWFAFGIGVSSDTALD
jgi:hypothetical protein